MVFAYIKGVRKIETNEQTQNTPNEQKMELLQLILIEGEQIH